MNKLVMVINGRGGVGKDALCDALGKRFKVINKSSVDPIKEIAARYGWQGEKTPKARKFLADLKQVFVEYNDLPTAYLLEQYKAFMESDAEIFCAHIREGAEIDKFMALIPTKHISMLIRRPDPNGIAPYGNVADDQVESYAYDHIFDNVLPLEESGEAFCELIAGILSDN
ncbi:MAG: hypothetical protein E7661_10300 [Ruminococcaceae bacterium]|nr:hypothetical protein [Oscillospiraceae bacterium]